MLFDDDKEVLKEAKAKGLYGIHVDYEKGRGFASLFTALDHFVKRFA